MSSTVNNSRVAIIGGHSKARGDFTSAGTLIVLGEFNGFVQCSHLMVMEGGKVEGFIEVQSVEVWGRVGGFARVEKMVCRGTSCLSGCVMAKSIALEPGVVLEGAIVFERIGDEEDEGKESGERKPGVVEAES
ncbi:MAG: bactofilin family protein [Candidatus Caldatribacteriaceae bacterium]